MAEVRKRILYSEAKIHAKVDQISKSVLAWLGIIDTSGLNLISVLEGARPLTTSLMNYLKKNAPSIQLHLYEIMVKENKNHPNLLLENRWKEGSLDLKVLREYPVLIVDDFMDSGVTIKKIKNQLLYLGVTNWLTVVLIRKFGVSSGSVDFLGFDLNWDRAALTELGFKDRLLYGYGMDLEGQKRDLPHIEMALIPIEQSLKRSRRIKEIINDVSLEGWITIGFYLLCVIYVLRDYLIKLFLVVLGIK